MRSSNIGDLRASLPSPSREGDASRVRFNDGDGYLPENVCSLPKKTGFCRGKFGERFLFLVNYTANLHLGNPLPLPFQHMSPGTITIPTRRSAKTLFTVAVYVFPQ